MAAFQTQTYAFSNATADDYEIVSALSEKQIAVTGYHLGAAGTNTVKFTDQIVDEVQTITVTEGNVVGVNEVQSVTITGGPTGGDFTLTYAGQTTGAIAFDATAAAVDTALEALSNIEVGDVAVTGDAGGPYTVTFGGALAFTNVAEMTASGAGLTGGTTPAVAIATVTAGVAYDSFTLTYSGQTTSAIFWDASAANVTSALEALSNIEVGDVVVTKVSAADGGVYTLTFAGALADTNVAQLTSTPTGCAVAHATSTGGGTTTDLTGPIPTVAGSQLVAVGSPDNPLFKTTAGSGLSVTLSASNSVAGFINYVVLTP